MATKYPVANRSFPVWLDGREHKVYVISRFNADLPTSAYNTMVATCFRQWAHIMTTIATEQEEPTGNLDVSAWHKITENDEPYPMAGDEPYVTVWGHPANSGITVTISEQVTLRQAWSAVQSLKFGLALFEQHASKLGVSFTRPVSNNSNPARNMNPLESTDMLFVSSDDKPALPKTSPAHKAPRSDIAYRKIQLMNDSTAMAFEWDSDTKGALCTIAQKQYDYKELYAVANDRIVFGVQSVAYNVDRGWVSLDIVSNDPLDNGRKMNIFRNTKSGDETFDFLAIDKDMKALGWDGSNDWTFNFAAGMFAVFKVSSKNDKTFWNFSHLYTITGLLPVAGGSADMPF